MTPLDARTTPSALRIPVLVLLALWVGYFATCATAALRTDVPSWMVLGRWQMFTIRNDRHTTLRAMGKVGDAWVDLDLDTLFPTQWESGPRFEDFDGKTGKLRVLAAATCGRSPLHPTEIEIFADRVQLRIGRAPKSLGAKKRLSWDCADAIDLPHGARW